MNIFSILMIIYYGLGIIFILYQLIKLKYNLENNVNYKIE